MSAAAHSDLELAGRRYETAFRTSACEATVTTAAGFKPLQFELKICFPLVNALPLAGSSTCPPIDEARLAHPSPGVARANIVGKTADVAGAPTAPRRNVWRDITTAIVSYREPRPVSERARAQTFITSCPKCDDHGPRFLR